MMLLHVSSELERTSLCGRSVWQTTFGLRGSDTSTAVKFFGALSCASQRMRRPSFAMSMDMPSPMPPKPCSRLCDSSLKFQLTTPSAPLFEALRRTAGLLTFGFAAFRAAFLAGLAAFFTAAFFLPAAFFTERDLLFARFINLLRS